MTDLLDIASRNDVHGSTARAMLVEIARWAPALRAEYAADDARDPAERVLLGSHDRWHMPRVSGSSPDALEPCRWRVDRDSHCLCFRCGGQEIETLLARSIVAPCAKASAGGCYWCCHAGSHGHYADGIVARALEIAGKAGRGEAAGKGGKGGKADHKRTRTNVQMGLFK